MLMYTTVALCSLLSILPSTLSAPLFIRDDANTTTTPVSNATVNADLNTPALFSRVIYCSVPAIQNLSCGSQCDALGGNVDVLQIGGDGGLVPMYLVASDPDNEQVVVAHQGTDLGMFMSLLNDAKFALKDLNTTRFTSADGLGIQVHDGFQETFERTADGVLSGVQSALAKTGMKKVLVTGHSLGAAIATLDAMMLKQNLDPSVNIQTTVFGLPRVGNQAWADFVDNGLSKTLKFVTNQNDIVPRVPPQFLDFVHPSGEIHINDVNAQGQATDVVACDGQDNESCSTGDSVLEVSIPDHLGPYFNDISFGGKACPT